MLRGSKLAHNLFSHNLRQLASSSLVFQSHACYHRQADALPRQYNFYWPKQQRKILYGKRIIPKIKAQFHDVLTLPSQSESTIYELAEEITYRKDIPISAENVCMMIHQFGKLQIMTKDLLDKLEKNAYRHKGQYKLRSLFGGIRGAILYNRQQLLDFFLEEYEAAEKKFTVYEMLQLIQALHENNHWPQQKKYAFWQKYIKTDFIDVMKIVRANKINILKRVIDAITQLEDYDEQLWDILIEKMDHKKGWGRIPMLERLYPLTGTFEKAKAIFDKYFEQLSGEDRILRRYNLTELRYYTPSQIIKINEENPADYWPKERTIIPEQQDPEEWNQLYEQYLVHGKQKQQEQIMKDRSKSFGYAIKDRYDSMVADNVDMSNLTKAEFVELFGSYEEAMKVIEQGKEANEEREGEDGQIEQDQKKDEEDTDDDK